VNGKVGEHPVVPGARPATSIAVAREGARSQLRIQDALQLAEQVGFPTWVEVDVEEDRRRLQERCRDRAEFGRTSTKAWSSSSTRSNAARRGLAGRSIELHGRDGPHAEQRFAETAHHRRRSQLGPFHANAW
jgi:hypothetical protein